MRGRGSSLRGGGYELDTLLADGLKTDPASIHYAVSKLDGAPTLTSRGPDELAVLVIDVQVGLFDTKPPPFEAREVIQRINAVTSRARAANIPVILVQHDGPQEGNWLRPFAPDWQLHPDLLKGPTDISLRKTTGDAFYKTDLERRLRSRGIRSLVLTGYATEFCLDATLRNAASKEFETFVVSDAHTTNDAPMIKGSVIREFFNWVWLDSPSRCGVHLLTAADVHFSTTPPR
jgi:nicotinamidase-related amidase